MHGDSDLKIHKQSPVAACTYGSVSLSPHNHNGINHNENSHIAISNNFVAWKHGHVVAVPCQLAHLSLFFHPRTFYRTSTLLPSAARRLFTSLACCRKKPIILIPIYSSSLPFGWQTMAPKKYFFSFIF